MKMLKSSKIVNEINMIIKRVDKENSLNDIIYISKNAEEKLLEFIVSTQILVKKDFNLILSFRKEVGGKVYRHQIENFILNKNGFKISNETNGTGIIGDIVQRSYKSITYQINNELNIKLNFLFQEGIYELTFSIEDEDKNEKILSVCPFEVRMQ